MAGAVAAQVARCTGLGAGTVPVVVLVSAGACAAVGTSVFGVAGALGDAGVVTAGTVSGTAEVGQGAVGLADAVPVVVLVAHVAQLARHTGVPGITATESSHSLLAGAMRTALNSSTRLTAQSHVAGLLAVAG